MGRYVIKQELKWNPLKYIVISSCFNLFPCCLKYALFIQHYFQRCHCHTISQTGNWGSNTTPSFTRRNWPARNLVSSVSSSLHNVNDAVSSQIWMLELTDTWMTPNKQYGDKLCVFSVVCLRLKKSPSYLRLYWIQLLLCLPLKLQC